MNPKDEFGKFTEPRSTFDEAFLPKGTGRTRKPRYCGAGFGRLAGVRWCTVLISAVLGATAAEQVEVATVPDAPTNVTASMFMLDRAGTSAAMVHFDPPESEGGSAVISYTVRASAAGGPSPKIEASGKSSPILISGLTPQRFHSISVTATNAVGQGRPSRDITAFPAFAPLGLFVADEPGNRLFAVDLDSGAIFGALGRFGDATYGNSSLRPLKRPTSLKADRHMNLFGADALGTFVFNPSFQNTMDRAAGNFSEVGLSRTNRSLMLDRESDSISGPKFTFDPVTLASRNDGKIPVIDSPDAVIAELDGSFTYTQIGSIAPGIFRLDPTTGDRTPVNVVFEDEPAADVIGTLQPSGIVRIADKYWVTNLHPAAVIEVDAKTGAGVIHIPVPKHGATRFVDVVAHPDGNTLYIAAPADERIFVFDLNTSTFTFLATPGLTPTSLAFARLPTFAPSAPVVTEVVASEGRALVSFNPPVGDGGATITGYAVTVYPGGQITTGQSSPITVSGLTDGIDYTFTVAAINSAGAGLAASAGVVESMEHMAANGRGRGLLATQPLAGPLLVVEK